MTAIDFTVPGTPIAKGNMRQAPNHGRLYDATKGTAQWARAVGYVARAAMAQARMQPFDGPVVLTCRFVFERPRSHYGTGRNANKLRPSAPAHHTVRPDLDKLVRNVKDAIKRVVWRDDAQVIGFGRDTGKRYANEGEAPHVAVLVEAES